LTPIMARQTIREILNVAERSLFRDDKYNTDQINEAHKALNYLATEVMEYQTLEALQKSRMGEANKLWYKAHPGREDCLPDLGEVLGWLISEMQINRTMALKLEKCVHEMIKETED